MDRRVFLGGLASAAAFPAIVAKGLFRPTKLVPMAKVVIPPDALLDLGAILEAEHRMMLEDMADEIIWNCYGPGSYAVEIAPYRPHTCK